MNPNSARFSLSRGARVMDTEMLEIMREVEALERDENKEYWVTKECVEGEE
jgi:hypothetical protein